MKTMKLGFLAVVAILVHQTSSLALPRAVEKKKMVCYYGSWAVYRPGNGKFDIENIDPFLCTHIVYGFAGLGSNNTIQALDPYNDLYENWGKGAYLRLTALKKKNPDLKTLIAIGGWNEGSLKYSKMAADPTQRSKFVTSVLNFVLTYGFDGFDFDWEYPANRGGDPIDKANFISVLRELKTAFAPYGLILTAAVSSGKETIDSAYDIPALSNLLDQIHLMCYDYHGAWETFTGLNAPLYANPKFDVGSNLLLNVNWTINYWIAQGAAPSKIVLGMPLYGRGFTLASASQNGFYVNAPQPIPAGPFTRESGTWGYNEICDKFRTESGWTVVRDPSYQAPYAYRNNLWIGYDDQQSLTLKAQYLMAMGLGGAMVWSLETDDFRGLCHGDPFFLIKTIVSTMSGSIVVTPTTTVTSPQSSSISTTSVALPTTTRANNATVAPTIGVTSTISLTPASTILPVTTVVTSPPTTTTSTTPPTIAASTTPTSTVTSTTANPTACGTSSSLAVTTSSTRFTTLPPLTTPTGAPTPNPICQKEGLNPDPNDCGVFYTCINNGQGGWTVYTQKCPTGTVFSSLMNTCTFPTQVPGCESYRP